MRECVASALFGLVPGPTMPVGDSSMFTPTHGRDEARAARRVQEYGEVGARGQPANPQWPDLHWPILTGPQWDEPHSAMVASAAASRMMTRAPSMVMTLSSLRRRS